MCFQDLERLARLRPRLEQRASILSELRTFLEKRGSLEVDTPSIVECPGTDIHLEPFAVDGRFLITSPEFHMKRLMGAGFHRIHQFCHCFRRDEAGIHHNPEFTMLEWYWAGVSSHELADELEQMVARVAIELNGTPRLPGRDVTVEPPWERLTIQEAFERYAGWSPGSQPDPDRFFLDLVERVEPNLGQGQPTILTDYPASQAVLSRLDPANQEVALRFEVYIDSIELVNAFDELTDAQEQRQRFEADNRAREAAGKPMLPIDEKLLLALDRMPQTSGAALGFDRLVMMLVGATSLSEVMAFPEPWL